ncbi:MAG: molybdopterin molybdotransferase MoeA [Ruminococcaceae bacterium]|nr:molybdopterin molybdotransferase MoeA [Oscillospiraceae bacterium]
MLTVKTSSEARQIIMDTFGYKLMETEQVTILDSVGRVLAEDIVSRENIPDFNRSTVDGYAVNAASTFGCSDSIPAILNFKGEVLISKSPAFEITKNECAYVPTGGELPQGADAMVMLEFSEDYGDGTRGMLKPSAPGQHVTFIGDDVKVGVKVLTVGTRLSARHIGALAALGYDKVMVYKKPKVAVLSTGDELVDLDEMLKGTMVRDINSYTICAALVELGCECIRIGIIKDELSILEAKVAEIIKSGVDMLIVSGGSSVGLKDATFKAYDKLGDVLFHGIAIKPGKPTIFANINDVPCFGLPGHPLAAYYVFNLFAKPLIKNMQGEKADIKDTKTLPLTLSIPCNHGREEYIGIRLVDNKAEPMYAKSGLISVLSKTDGYLRIDRDCEGLLDGEEVEVELF